MYLKFVVLKYKDIAFFLFIILIFTKILWHIIFRPLITIFNAAGEDFHILILLLVSDFGINLSGLN